MVLPAASRGVNECVPLRGPNFCDTAEKWPLAEIFATAKFARHEADFSLDTVPKECLGPWLGPNFTLTRKYKNFSLPAESQTFIRKFWTSHT